MLGSSHGRNFVSSFKIKKLAKKFYLNHISRITSSKKPRLVIFNEKISFSASDFNFPRFSRQSLGNNNNNNVSFGIEIFKNN